MQTSLFVWKLINFSDREVVLLLHYLVELNCSRAVNLLNSKILDDVELIEGTLQLFSWLIVNCSILVRAINVSFFLLFLICFILVTEWDSYEYNRLALYLDGDLEKLPLREGLQDQKIVKKSSTEIILLNPLASWINIRLNETKARVHAFSASYVYPALCGQCIPFEWTHYEATVQGEIFSISHTKFRPGTQTIRFGFLANYGQSGKEVEMVVKNFKFWESKYSFWTENFRLLIESLIMLYWCPSFLNQFDTINGTICLLISCYIINQDVKKW